MKHETSLALHAYWRNSRATAGVSTSGIRAAELIPFLPWLFLLDLTDSDDPRFRFCGGALTIRYGHDLTGEGFLHLWNAEDRRTLEHGLRVFEVRSSGIVAGVMAETIGSGFTAFEMLLLPLAVDGVTAGAIGSMVRIAGHEETNRVRARVIAQWLRSVRILAAAVQHGEVSAPFVLPSPPPARRYRHLTVLRGGKQGPATAG